MCVYVFIFNAMLRLQNSKIAVFMCVRERENGEAFSFQLSNALNRGYPVINCNLKIIKFIFN